MYRRRETAKSESLFARAVEVIPGGVNSPVRAYGSVGMNPRFLQAADGPYVFDADGNKYIDYIGSWGPMILGHNNHEVLDAVTRTCQHGLSFGAATAIEVDGRIYLRQYQRYGNDPYGQFRYRGCDERHSCSQRLYKEKQDRKVCRMLPWPF